MRAIKKVNLSAYVWVWLVNPLLAALPLMRDFGRQRNMLPFLLLSFFFGLSFVLVPGSGIDATRYAAELAFHHEAGTSFSKYIGGVYSEGSKVDLYQPLVTWTVSRFTGNYQWLFGMFSLVFGYFWFKVLLLIRQQIRIPFRGLVLAAFLLVALINPIWSINGVRMWTAVQMFFYGLLVFHVQGQKKAWIWLVLPVFVHFSLAFPLALYLVLRFVPVRSVQPFFYGYLATFFVGELDLDLVRSYFELLPGFLQSRKAYLNEAYVEQIAKADKNLGTHVLVAKFLQRYSMVATVLFIYYFYYVRSRLRLGKPHTVFVLALLYSSFSNLLLQIPSGGRYIVLSNLLLLVSLIYFLSESNFRIPAVWKYLLLVSFSLVGIFKIREGFDFIGIFFIIGNPVINLLVQDTTPLIVFIKSLL
ncbi:EpsG family protein [Cyclobacterium xiamenense]|uniref:EpsG family protein n=1 Tax=Cyclobacterium xiamenense TaxID=1297121 RepID=UPI0035D0B1D0